jgi:hypothetical protein
MPSTFTLLFQEGAQSQRAQASQPLPFPLSIFFPPERVAPEEPKEAVADSPNSDGGMPIPTPVDSHPESAALPSECKKDVNGMRGRVADVLDALHLNDGIDEDLAPDVFFCPISQVRERDMALHNRLGCSSTSFLLLR